MTQHDQILGYLDLFGKITPMEAFSDLGITKLATRVGELKNRGYNITGEITHGKNRLGKPVHYMTYTIKKQTQTNREEKNNEII